MSEAAQETAGEAVREPVRARDAGRRESEPRGGMRPGIAIASLAVALAAAAAGIVVVRRAVQRMPPLSPTDSMIVAGGRPGTPGAAAPSPVRPVPPRARGDRPEPPTGRRPENRPAADGNAPSYPRLQ